MADNYDILVTLHEIKKLLERQNQILESLQTNQTQTKITVVGNKAQTAVPKGLNSKDDFTL